MKCETRSFNIAEIRSSHRLLWMAVLFKILMLFGQYSAQAQCDITISPSSLPAGTANVSYSEQLTASGASGTFTFALVSGSPPANITLSSSGLLSGTPIRTGPFSFKVKATATNGCAGTNSYTLTINCPTITLSPGTLPNGTVGTTYSQALSASGGNGTYTFTVVSGSLPNGLSLSSGGSLSGTPHSAGTCFTVQAEDTNNCTGTNSYCISNACPTITLTPTTLPNGTVGAPYGPVQLSASGGDDPYTFSGSPPSGLSLSASGLLSGTNTVPGVSCFTVTATDTNGCPGSMIYCITNTICIPTLLLTNYTITCNAPFPTNQPGVSDLCCSNVYVSLLYSTTNGNGCTTVVTQWWQAVDLCSGTSNINFRTITTLPSFPTLLLTNYTITCNAPFPTNQPGVSDPCCDNVYVNLLYSTTNGNGCTTVVTQWWQAVDLCCGTSNINYRTITTLPSSPTLLPTNINLTCGSPIPTNPPAYSDPCCSNVQVELIGSTTIAEGCTLVVTQTWQAVDLCCGTTSTCIRLVTISYSGPWTLTELHQFNPGVDGYDPNALVQGTDGNFYGTTWSGGEGGYGTVFRMSSTSPYTLTTLHAFDLADGANSFAALVQGNDGNFYGTTAAGPDTQSYGYGTIFQISPAPPLHFDHHAHLFWLWKQRRRGE